MSHGHRFGHHADMSETIAFLALGANGGEQDHLIDNVTVDPAVVAQGPGTVVVLDGDNEVGIAVQPPVGTMISYGVYVGEAGRIRTYGIIPALQIDPTLAVAPTPGQLLYVSGNTPGTMTTVAQIDATPSGWCVDPTAFGATHTVKAFFIQAFHEGGPPP